MKLLQLYYFQAACRCQNITKAAELLHISQPSVSAAIRELEKEFGLTLLERKGKSFTLTPEGTVFLKQAEGLLDHARDFQESMQQLTQNQETIRLGIPPMIGSILLPLIYSSPSLPRDNVKISITESGRREILYQLNNNQLDMAFLPHNQPVDAAYRSIPIMQLETVCCISLTHSLVNRRKLSVAELNGEPLVLFKNSFFQTESILKRFEEEHIFPNILLQTEQLSTVRKFVARNLAVGFMFSRISETVRDIVSIPLDPPMPVQVSLIWKQNNYLSHGKTCFLNCVRDLAV